MANFIRKIVERARSRSKSPTKQQNSDELRQRYINEQQQWWKCGLQTQTFDNFIHPNCDSQNFQENNQQWKAKQLNDKLISHYTTLHHQLDVNHPENELIVPGSKQLGSIHDVKLSKPNEILDPLSGPANDYKHYFDQSIKNLDLKKKLNNRLRSCSPEKATQTTFDEALTKSRSKSPIKRLLQTSETLNYLSPQCHFGKCSAALIVQDKKFLVCKHQLSHVSDYFRVLFSTDKSAPCQSSCNEFAVIVSSLKNPPPAVQFKWFLEATIKTFGDVTDEMLETCMRLSKRFRAKHLEMKCAKYIQDNVAKRTPMVALCWLNWVLKHKFDRITHDACLPCVAAASVQCLEEHRNLISERLLADLLAAKLRTLYDQAVTVFQTIHSMDHFYVDVPSCPNCGYQRQQGKVRIQASPCRKMLGCEQCLKEFGCNLSGKDYKNLQACYQCEHGLVALNDHTADCQCQIPLLASHLRGLQSHFLSINNPQ